MSYTINIRKHTMALTLIEVGIDGSWSTINSNFQKIEDEINNKVIRREIDGGEANEMRTHLDMNNQRGVNVAPGVNDNDIPTYKQLIDFAGSIPISEETAVQAAIDAEASADIAQAQVPLCEAETTKCIAETAKAEGFAIDAALSAVEASGYVSTSELEVLARGLNVTDAEVVYGMASVVLPTIVGYIHNPVSQITWIKPPAVGNNEVIVSMIGNQLVTDVTTYTMDVVVNITDLEDELDTNTSDILANTNFIAAHRTGEHVSLFSGLASHGVTIDWASTLGGLGATTADLSAYIFTSKIVEFDRHYRYSVYVPMELMQLALDDTISGGNNLALAEFNWVDSSNYGVVEAIVNSLTDVTISSASVNDGITQVIGIWK